MFSCICINLSSESKVLEPPYRAFMINVINIKRTFNFLCVLVLRRVNKFCKQSILWKGSTMPEIYQQFLFQVSTSFSVLALFSSLPGSHSLIRPRGIRKDQNLNVKRYTHHRKALVFLSSFLSLISNFEHLLEKWLL